MDTRQSESYRSSYESSLPSARFEAPIYVKPANLNQRRFQLFHLLSADSLTPTAPQGELFQRIAVLSLPGTSLEGTDTQRTQRFVVSLCPPPIRLA